MRAAVAEARHLGGVRVAEHAAELLGAAAAGRRRVEEAVDAEAGAERAGRRQAAEGGEPGDEVGEDAVCEEERDEDPLEERVGEQSRDPAALLANGRGAVRRHGRLRLRGHHLPGSVCRRPGGNAIEINVE